MFLEKTKDGRGLYEEFKLGLSQKVCLIQKITDGKVASFNAIQKKLDELLKLQSVYLKNEKEGFELYCKLSDLHSHNEAVLSEMLRLVMITQMSCFNLYLLFRVVNMLNESMELQQLEENRNVEDIQAEMQDFMEKQRVKIWRFYLRKRLESLKATIVNNLDLN